jgi:hypothetical protein
MVAGSVVEGVGNGGGGTDDADSPHAGGAERVDLVVVFVDEYHRDPVHTR